MTTYTKIGLVAVVLLVAGGIYLSMSGGAPTVMAPNEDTAMMQKDTMTPEPVAATGSVDEIASALLAELAAESAGIAAFDAAVSADARAVEDLTNSNTIDYGQDL